MKNSNAVTNILVTLLWCVVSVGCVADEVKKTSLPTTECSMDGNQTDMNACARQRFDIQEKKLNDYFQVVLKEAPEEIQGEKIKSSQEAWLKATEMHCALLKNWGGSMAPMRYYKCMVEHMIQRQKEMKFYMCHPSLSECEQ